MTPNRTEVRHRSTVFASRSVPVALLGLPSSFLSTHTAAPWRPKVLQPTSLTLRCADLVAGVTPPKASYLPDSVLDLLPKLDNVRQPDEQTLDDLESASASFISLCLASVETFRAAYQRACNYLASAMIFLTKAPFEKEGFTQEIVKKRLLGHFGASFHFIVWPK